MNEIGVYYDVLDTFLPKEISNFFRHIREDYYENESESEIYKYDNDKIKIMITHRFRLKYSRLKDVTIELEYYF